VLKYTCWPIPGWWVPQALGRVTWVFHFLLECAWNFRKFIEKLTGAEDIVGHGLEPTTQDITVFECTLLAVDNSTIYLVDTPGFDDIDRTDCDVFKMISTWLIETYFRFQNIYVLRWYAPQLATVEKSVLRAYFISTASRIIGCRNATAQLDQFPETLRTWIGQGHPYDHYVGRGRRGDRHYARKRAERRVLGTSDWLWLIRETILE